MALVYYLKGDVSSAAPGDTAEPRAGNGVCGDERLAGTPAEGRET